MNGQNCLLCLLLRVLCFFVDMAGKRQVYSAAALGFSDDTTLSALTTTSKGSRWYLPPATGIFQWLTSTMNPPLMALHAWLSRRPRQDHFSLLET